MDPPSLRSLGRICGLSSRPLGRQASDPCFVARCLGGGPSFTEQECGRWQGEVQWKQRVRLHPSMTCTCSSPLLAAAMTRYGDPCRLLLDSCLLRTKNIQFCISVQWTIVWSLHCGRHFHISICFCDRLCCSTLLYHEHNIHIYQRLPVSYIWIKGDGPLDKKKWSGWPFVIYFAGRLEDKR